MQKLRVFCTNVNHAIIVGHEKQKKLCCYCEERWLGEFYRFNYIAPQIFNASKLGSLILSQWSQTYGCIFNLTLRGRRLQSTTSNIDFKRGQLGQVPQPWLATLALAGHLPSLSSASGLAGS